MPEPSPFQKLSVKRRVVHAKIPDAIVRTLLRDALAEQGFSVFRVTGLRGNKAICAEIGTTWIIAQDEHEAIQTFIENERIRDLRSITAEPVNLCEDEEGK